MSKIITWQELRDAVGKWSQANFGTQAGLGALAPLMGMCEEVGELDTARTPDEFDDARGDILIFLMDYCYRAGVDLSGLPIDLSGLPILQESCHKTVAEVVGELHHVQLKRLQRIRGMDDYETFRSAQHLAVAGILSCTGISGTSPSAYPFYLARHVWNNVVSKRQWKDYTGQAATRDQCLYDFNAVLGELHQGL